MATYRAIEIPKAGGGMHLVERPIPQPGRGKVLVRVQACGICHSDSITAQGLFPWISYPRVPGHEVAGVIEALGEDVQGWEVGQRVGVGWFGGHCGHCPSCRRGDFLHCMTPLVSGISYDGGYADVMVAPASALAAIPDDLSAVEAAPLLCAGITTFNALRQSGAKAGDTVAILGIGGLGHLAVQYAAHMGFRTVAIARGTDKEALALKLGAHHYIDSKAGDPAAALQALGGAKVLLSTVTSGPAISAMVGGMAKHGRIVVVGVSHEPIQLDTMALVGGELSVSGHASGTATDSEDTLNFSVLTGVRPMIETVPLEQAFEGYDKMMRGDARFRMVLVTGQ